MSKTRFGRKVATDIDVEAYAKLTAEAQKQGLNLAQYIRAVLRKELRSLEEPEAPRNEAP